VADNAGDTGEFDWHPMANKPMATLPKNTDIPCFMFNSVAKAINHKGSRSFTEERAAAGFSQIFLCGTPRNSVVNRVSNSFEGHFKFEIVIFKGDPIRRAHCWL
jgi:hypothetical protein